MIFDLLSFQNFPSFSLFQNFVNNSIFSESNLFLFSILNVFETEKILTKSTQNRTYINFITIKEFIPFLLNTTINFLSIFSSKKSLQRKMHSNTPAMLDEEPGENLLSRNMVYIKIEDIDYGSFPVDSSTAIVIAFGSRKTYQQNLLTIQGHEHAPKKVWSFGYKNPTKSSFVIVLYKYKFFGKNQEIGEIELRLGGFTENRVTTHEFTMKSPNRGREPKITLTVHVSEDGASAFDAESCSEVKDSVIVKTSYFLG